MVSSLSPQAVGQEVRRRPARAGLVGRDAQRQVAAGEAGTKALVAGEPERGTGEVGFRQPSGEIWVRPLACTTSSLTAPSLTIRK